MQLSIVLLNVVVPKAPVAESAGSKVSRLFTSARRGDPAVCRIKMAEHEYGCSLG